MKPLNFKKTMPHAQRQLRRENVAKVRREAAERAAREDERQTVQGGLKWGF